MPPAATEADFTAVDAVVERLGRDRSHVVAWLQAIQEHDHYLPAAALRRLAALTGVSESELTSVATFYNQFRLRPAGAHPIRVCIGTACHVKGADRVFDAFRSALELPDGVDTDSQGLFTVEKVACLGCCMLAPAVQIGQTIYGHVTPQGAAGVIRDFLAGLGAAEARPKQPGRSGAAGEVRLCTCSSCGAAGATAVAAALAGRAAAWGLPLNVREASCLGASYDAPLVDIVTPAGTHRYGRVKATDAGALLERHFGPAVPLVPRLAAAANRLLDRLVAGDDPDPPVRFPPSVRDQPDAPFWSHQTRWATEGAGESDPLDLEAWRRSGGFTVLTDLVTARAAGASPVAMTARQHIVEQLTASGLRGRGGGGYATGCKWHAVAASASGGTRYVICNGDEGDPGAFMDRMILESFPFRVLEGMAIAGLTVGAEEGILYVRHEYPLAVARLRAAIERCEAAGLLGSSVLGTGLRLRFRVVEGAGAFVCGEETALIASLEGRRGTPRFRPPYPAERGLHGQPTLINNVETFALVPWILRHGSAAFRSQGTHASPGTKTFALAGRVRRGGLVEVPMGMTLRQVIDEMGGGVAEGRQLKAVQIGGPSGGCLPAVLADTPVDFEALAVAGAMMGSGGMVVLDDRDCMVDIARYFLDFTQRESCGQCTPCRIGTRRMLELLERLCEGRGHASDLAALEELAHAVASGSLCGLGRTAPNPVISALRHFRSEFEAHLRGECPAGRCRSLIRYRVTNACIGCTRCSQHCSVQAIPFTPLQAAVIDDGLCTRCDTCRQVCPVNAIVVTPGNR